MASLFDPLTLRSITFRNRIAVSPMCQYSSEDGFANDWHVVHLGSRAVGGAGLVMTEASAVSPAGRITPGDLGIYRDEHVPVLKRITGFIASQGSVPGIQLAHAGRKASCATPWQGGNQLSEAEGGWQPLAPSPLAFRGEDRLPAALSEGQIAAVISDFAAAALRAREAGFKVIELHAAHGYLIHQFYSPLSNRRTDQYGGNLENRCRLPVEIARAVRAVWPEELPLFVRISATDWTDEGWTPEDSVFLAKKLQAEGVDLIDCSSGGNAPVRIPLGPGYQVPFAEKLKREAGMATGAVGLITDARQAQDIIAADKADLVLLARQMLRDPYFPLHAAQELGQEISWPVQYERAKPHRN
ncbi:NADH:flavin oxidoreductase/NADH oxidase [Compostibacter hankyongensis]|uniref:NADH:flavin oxidoreductase/NADH oxidase n=1 Tax=Compostibacter hankyongensis TaxID=1007089 RepID=A0ABP8FPZ7_9BACT